MVVGATEVFLPLEGLVDLEAERGRLAKELAGLEGLIGKSLALLESDFTSKAPAAVVDKERAKLEGLQESRRKMAERLRAIEA
jgi:valyl-tRNA synthetase